MAKAPKKDISAEIQITALSRASVTLRIIGTTPLFQNRMSAKVQQYLLIGAARKGKADRANIKHDPLTEYRASAETIATGPTALGVRVVAVKAAMCDAALETPGMTKVGAQRLIFMPGDHFHLFGIPQLRMDVVRSADIARTPDVRTRCYLPKWGAEVTVSYITPQLSATSVVTLLANAGVLIGVGDFRQQKGKGAFGSFRVIGPEEPDDEWDDLVANHGRMAQLRALNSPEYANEETADLMRHYGEEVKKRAA